MQSIKKICTFLFFLGTAIISRSQSHTLKFLSADDKVEFQARLEYKNIIINSEGYTITINEKYFKQIQNKAFKFLDGFDEPANADSNHNDFVKIIITKPVFFLRNYWLPDMLMRDPTIGALCIERDCLAYRKKKLKTKVKAD